MQRNDKIPTLGISDLNEFHSNSIDWLPLIANTKHQYFHINRLEDITDKANFQVLPHRKVVHDFIFLKYGACTRTKGLSSYDFGESSIFFLPAYQITQHSKMSLDANGFYCHFNEDIFDSLPNNFIQNQYPFFQYQSHPVVKLSTQTVVIVESILKRLIYLYTMKEKPQKRLVAFYLLSLFEEITNEIEKDVQKKKNSFLEITEKYKFALAANIYRYQKIVDYANLLNITPNYLNKCVKTCTNQTAQSLLKEMIILEAKTLIKYSDLHVSEIAAKLCNQTPSNFARFFKNQTGHTPKEYAQMY